MNRFLAYSGAPGRFLYVPRALAKDFSAHLRVYDASRSTINLGTEIPIVSSSAFRYGRFGLSGVPLNPRFRNTLRLYAAEPTEVRVTMGAETHLVALRGSGDSFTPAYAMFSDFPTGAGYTTVIVEPVDPSSAGVWGFISVTNNETQSITTITPQ
jgi:hypothetical protein